MLAQLKILTTAVMSILILSRKLSWQQWCALVVLTVGCAMVQVRGGVRVCAPACAAAVVCACVCVCDCDCVCLSVGRSVFEREREREREREIDR